MDKILAFSILSSSPADISATGFSTRLSWRASSAGTSQQSHKRQQEKPQRQHEKKAAGNQAERKPEPRARFAPEFDGINCFESIVSL